MFARLSKFALEVVLIPSVMLAAFGLHRANQSLEASAVQRAATGDIEALPDGRAVRTLSLGFERLVADLFWIRTVYYVGDEVSSDAGWPAAEPLAMLVTDIDPGFDSAYVVMSSVLNGLRPDPDAAIRLLEKGAAVSSYWRVHFLLGFQYFVEKGDYERGAKCLERAIALGGPAYLPFLVSRLYAAAGDPTTAMQFLGARLQSEETPEVRAKLEERLAGIWIDRDLGAIDGAIAEFKKTQKRAPKSVAELVGAGLLPNAPRDPKGGAYSIVDGRAHTDLPHESVRLYNSRGGDRK